MPKSRNVNLDLIRCVAIISVISVHFFLNIGFYNEPVLGKKMLLMVMMRTFFMVCVPLFILLTGYLMADREIMITKKYLLKLSKVIVPYVLITIAILLVMKYYQHADVGVWSGILNITGFKQYAWYVNMYLGLYLLIPFLNRIWNALKSKREAMLLLGVLLILTVLPSILNTFDLTTAGWWKAPWTSKSYNQLVPSWWSGLYPLTYYFIGAYFKKYVKPGSIRPFKPLLALAACVCLFSLYNYYRSYSVNFIWGMWADWGGFENVIDAVLLFLFLNALPLARAPRAVSAVLAKISDLSFGTYIASWIMDLFVYEWVKSQIPNMRDRLWVFIPAVAAVFIGANLISFVADTIPKLCGKCYARLKQHKAGT